jgi:hypothetical protein
MAKITGNTGNVSYNSGDIKITGWTVDLKTEVQDITDSGDLSGGYKVFQGNGWKEWEGSFEGWQETGVADPALGTPATLVLGFNTSATIKYSGSAIITGVSTALQIAGTTAVKKTYNFKGTGPLTLTNS